MQSLSFFSPIVSYLIIYLKKRKTDALPIYNLNYKLIILNLVPRSQSVKPYATPDFHGTWSIHYYVLYIHIVTNRYIFA